MENSSNLENWIKKRYFTLQEKFKKNREVSLTKEYFDNIYKNKRENLFNEYRK